MCRIRFRLSRPFKLGLWILLVLSVCCFLFSRREEGELAALPDHSVLHLGIENPGTVIALVEPDSNLSPNAEMIRVFTPWRSFSLHSLKPLQGLVHIGEAKQALHFVRFRTSRDYCYNWHGENTPQEIVSFSQCNASEFSDTGEHSRIGESGRYGLLSDKAYRLGKFTPPEVTSISGGYQIVRWVCVYVGLDGNAVQQWQERVTNEGAYQCIVLKSVPPPKLPDTQWFIYGLK